MIIVNIAFSTENFKSHHCNWLINDGDDDEDFNRFDQKISLSVLDILRERQTMCQLKMALFGTACPSNMDFMTTVKAIL